MFRWVDLADGQSSLRMSSAARHAIAMTGAFRLPETIVGIDRDVHHAESADTADAKPGVDRIVGVGPHRYCPAGVEAGAAIEVAGGEDCLVVRGDQTGLDLDACDLGDGDCRTISRIRRNRSTEMVRSCEVER